MKTNTAAAAKKSIKCSKCMGSGKLNWTSIDNGRCFRCGGSGCMTVDVQELAVSRAKSIATLADYLNRFDLTSTDEDTLHDAEIFIGGEIGRAPADVAERALAAAERMGASASTLRYFRACIAFANAAA